jgi:hypothetical protein
MARIRVYEPQTQAAGPVREHRTTANDFGAQGGEALQHVGNSLTYAADVLERRAEQSEVSDLTAKFAEAHATFTNQWAETLKTAKPGDNTLHDKFLEQYNEYIGKVGENIQTRGGEEYYKKMSAQMRGHFSETAMAGQVELAGVKARQDYQSTINNFSSSLINDPSSFDFVKQAHQAGLDNLVQSHNLPSAVAAELKTKGEAELAKSAIRGWIKNNPEFAKEQLKSDKWDQYILGDVKKQMFGEADEAIRGKQIEADRARKEQERIRDEKNRLVENDFLKKNEANQLTPKDVLDSDLNPPVKRIYLNIIDKNNKERLDKTDPQTWNDVMERIYLPDGDPRKILDERELLPYHLAGKLSYSSLNHARDEVNGRKTEQGRIEADMKKQVFDMAKEALVKSNPLLGLRDPEGQLQMAKFQQAFYEEFASQRKKGASTVELLDPKSPKFLGKLVEPFRKDFRQLIKDNIRAGGLDPQDNKIPKADPAKARKEGESATDWVNRVMLQKAPGKSE